ncbi:hypothetical protein ACM64Y_07175 [Novispirillum sp. DQ9]|uniref:hypothetical protein n=1 Tax=Novispirillum sp. DQ9 TaxID=3398612 RepID=UPI003C7CD31C
MIAWLARHARVLLAASLLAGIALPDLASALKPWLPAGIAGLLWGAMVRLDWTAVRAHLGRPARLAAGLGWMMLAVPFAAWAVAAALDLSSGLTAGLVLMACAPPVMSLPAIALMVGLDAALALLLVVVGTFLAPLTAPVLLHLLADLDIAVGAAGMALRLGLLVGGCAGAAVLFRRVLGPRGMARAQPGLELFNLACLTLFAIAVMDGVADALRAEPGRVAVLIAGAYAAALALMAVTAAVFARLGRPTALALGYAAGTRNMALMMAAVPTATTATATGLEDLWLWFGLVQFPIYTLPMVLARPIRRLLR